MKKEETLARLAGKRIGVLMGGLSSERDISLKTGEAVLASLKRLGMNAAGIDAGRDLCARISQERVDVAFIALHGRYGEDGCVQGALEVMGIPYTGSGVTASALAMNKPLAKTLLAASGVRTPNWTTFTKESLGEALAKLSAPVVIKPAASGSSIGVTICMKGADIPDAAGKALGEDAVAMAEDYVEGRLVTVGVLGSVVLPPIEIETISGFYDYENKYTPGRTRYHLPARLGEAVLNSLSGATMNAHRTLGCRGLSRSEFIVDDGGEAWFLELNTLPGMTATSLLPKAAGAVGLSFDDLVLAILEEATHGR